MISPKRWIQNWKQSLKKNTERHFSTGSGACSGESVSKRRTLWECCCWSLLYSDILRSRVDSLLSHVILREWIVFYSAFLNIHRSGALTGLAWLVPLEAATISARSVYIIHPYTMLFLQSHIREVHAYLAVTCHLHFWQNDRDLLRATAVTRGWNRCVKNRRRYFHLITSFGSYLESK